ncbi:LrgB family protein [Halobacillus litoralis]|uniref:LrgB family protein n=1 Tax=Halobacillus litoralis TaxID=45668 RepID=A0A845DTU3_9BACI|nr:LrgB family protein [Halobacillus litoralis]MYL20578.1 LrgB family protein [Halobacillus litoralis]MYL36885.1 LrgB family protein [Halobacillus litoralis]
MSTALLMMVMTVAIYLATLFVYRRHRRLYTTPVIVSTALIVIILLVFHLPYETYMTGGKWIDRLLGPAVVALAYPLYQFRDILKKMFVPIMTGTVIGAVVGIVSGLLLSKWAGFSDLIIHSIVPKSVTTPVAMSISESTGGVMPLTAVFVMIAGIGGLLIHPFVLKVSGLTHRIGRGVGMGSASHAIGTSASMERDTMEGSISTVAMVLSAVIVSIIAPGLTLLFM